MSRHMRANAPARPRPPAGSSPIEWTQATWNPVTGCDRVSPGCDHCYALTMAARLKTMGAAKYQADGHPVTFGPGFGVTTHGSALTAPLHWAAPRTVFVNSMSDLFHPRVGEEFIARVLATMALTPRHTYQVLTKRHARMRALLAGRRLRERVTDALTKLRDHDDAEFSPEQQALLRRPAHNLPWPLPNLWVGVSTEDQFRADIRIPALLDTPAAVRFVSAEPLLGPIRLAPEDHTGHDPDHQGETSVDWVIIGGESGAQARPMDLAWARSLRDDAHRAGAAVFVKQLGTVWARGASARSKGGDPNHWPEDLRLREMPPVAGGAR